MKLPFPSHKASGQTIAVCDLGSGSVAVGIVELLGDEDPGARVLISGRQALPLAERTNAQTIEQMKTLAQETAHVIVTEHARRGGVPPARVVALVHAPWIRSETLFATEHFDRPTLVTATHIKELAARAILQPTDLDMQRIFERSVTRVALNGYPTAKPEGKTATHIDIAVLESDINTAFEEAMQAALGAVFVGRSIAFNSAFFAFSVVAHQILPELSHYTFVDVTSLATTAVVVRRGGVLAQASAPLGWRHIAMDLAEKAGTTPEEALSRARMASADTCTDALCSSVVSALDKIEIPTAAAYGKMFDQLARTKRIPGMLILVAPPDLAGWFATLFARIDFAQFTVSETPLTVNQFLGKHLSEVAQFAPGLEEDTGIAVAAGFVHTRELSKHT